jgi:hypothetical protein
MQLPPGPPRDSADAQRIADALQAPRFHEIARAAAVLAARPIPGDGDAGDVLTQVIGEARAQPDSVAKQRLESLLQAAQMDRAIQESDEISRLVTLMRELLSNYRAGETMEELLAPLETLFRRMDAQRAAEAERVRARKPLTQRIKDMLVRENRRGTAVKVVLKRWEKEAIEGLRLSPDGTDHYIVADENADESDTKRFKRTTLETYYSSPPKIQR